MRVAVALGVLVGGWCLGIHGDRTQWEVSLLKLPRSVGWKFLYSELRSS